MRVLTLVSAAAGLAALGLVAVIAWPVGSVPAPIELTGDSQRGAYLARAGGCIACHTNWDEGGPPLAGGAPLETRFGTFHPPNLTMSASAGMGNWTITQFARAVRQGVSPDGASYYPTFPYAFYANLTDQDIADLWAAFQTVPAVDTPAPDNEVPFPFDQRWGLKLWRAAFLPAPRTEPVEGKSDPWNQGRWLVEGVTHCGACHTPRNIAGARVMAQKFTGADALPGQDKSPAITPDALAENGWTRDDLAYALQSGIMPNGDTFGGGMGEVVRHGTSFLTDADRRAIATYLLDEDG
ncbi:cytochrome c [Maribius pontilimi]|uniref:Cytochrome c n=1 Tax=Palleronia pontilimi TaxID=1964209 RepID=A0A934IEY5_9RHOB|nr:cytochrome c [Palleronia pontilimi]MBJ3761501.1 cytochrome c [Palleronia pontilimi]